MKRYELLNQWLEDRQRKYADGLDLFKVLAKPALKEKYSKFLETGSASPHIFDPRFTQLVNCLTKIFREIQTAPALYPVAQEETAAQVMKPEAVKEEVDTRVKLVADLKETIADLQSQISENEETITELEDNAEEHAAEIEALNEELEENNRLLTDKLAELKKVQDELAVLQTPGVKIITEASLTPGLKKDYDRIREIVPLYASLHAEISNPDIANEKRKELAEELCKLDDERRKLWKQIDDWAEGKGELKLEAERPAFSENNVVRGFEIARRIKRLNENIARSRQSAEKAEKEGKKKTLQNAQERIAMYETELAALQKEISAPGETTA